MTVSTNLSSANYTGNGATFAFTVPFYFLDQTHLAVYRTQISTGVQTLLALTTDYTVTGAGVGAGGTVTTTAAPTGDQRINIVRNVPFDQQTHYVPNDPFPAATHEAALDKLTMEVQQVYELAGRAFVVAPGGSTGGPLPSATARASKFLAFDSLGVPVASAGTGVDASLRTDLAASTGSTLVSALQAGTGAQARQLQTWLREVCISVTHFGATGDGVTDDTTAIQNAITAAGNRTLFFPPGIYKITSTLIVGKATMLRGDNNGDDTSNTNGNGSFPVRLVWAGAVAGTMLRFASPTAGNCLWGAGFDQMELDGSTTASYGAVYQNTKRCVVGRVQVRNVRVAGIEFNSDTGTAGNFCQQNTVEDYHFVWGVAAICQSAHGLNIRGNGSTIPGTQHFVKRIWGLIYSGALVRIVETDNCVFQSVQGFTQNVAGTAVTLLNSGAGPAYANVFHYVAGKIAIDNGAYANVFHHIISEGGGLVQLAGTAVWHGEVVDYTTQKRFGSHKYKLRDKINVSSSDLVRDLGATTAVYGSSYGCTSMPDAGTARISHMRMGNYDLANGVIEGVEFLCTSDGASGGSFQVDLYAGSFPDGVTGFTPQQSLTGTTFTAPAQNVLKTATLTFATPLTYVAGQTIFVKLVRNGTTPAADTNTDNLLVFGMRLLYKSNGPDSSGSGTWAIPAW